MKYTFAVLACLVAMPAFAEVHEVGMFNRSENGPMIYEPSFLHIAPGDSVRFIPSQPSHNAATIDTMIPEGAAPFKSKINEDFTIAFDVPGNYGIKCSPHIAMGMVMLIQVGDAEDVALPDDLPKKARERFEAILAAHHAPD
ncbi:pseudoazurin [Paenirhodobacter populi]|uniref:Pseudoazurin n=1 Tax=Paenirhodobacter populi TaxID=2306993 RepID=A0A443JAJ7_9RHOB|nr:pseudoazurin [Sinirhodobacter populi]RWR05259.1 pseudoazurin [Sinirhodobacter populi]RWR17494.1 pseudoazurin [Sinirhodobacter populi]